MKKIILIIFLAASFSVYAMQEIKEKEELSAITKETSPLVSKINKHRSEYLEEYLPKVLSNLIKQYDPIKDEWKCEQTVKTHEEWAISECVLPGNKLAYASNDRTIKIWNLETDLLEKILQTHHLYINSICALPKNKLACASSAGIITIWNLETCVCEQQLDDHVCAIMSICLLQENKLASSSRDKTIKIWTNSATSSDSTDEEFAKFMHEKEPMKKEKSSCVIS